VCAKLKIDDVFILRFWMPELLIRIKKTELQDYFCAFNNNHSGVCGYYLFFAVFFIIFVTIVILVFVHCVEFNGFSSDL